MEKMRLEFTESEAAMLKRLTSCLALSVGTIIESAINYVYFYTKSRGLEVEQLVEYSHVAKPFAFEVSLAAQTTHKLNELGMNHHINECVVTGIHLLYNQLIEEVGIRA